MEAIDRVFALIKQGTVEYVGRLMNMRAARNLQARLITNMQQCAYTVHDKQSDYRYSLVESSGFAIELASFEELTVPRGGDAYKQAARLTGEALEHFNKVAMDDPAGFRAFCREAGQGLVATCDVLISLNPAWSGPAIWRLVPDLGNVLGDYMRDLLSVYLDEETRHAGSNGLAASPTFYPFIETNASKTARDIVIRRQRPPSTTTTTTSARPTQRAAEKREFEARVLALHWEQLTLESELIASRLRKRCLARVGIGCLRYIDRSIHEARTRHLAEILPAQNQERDPAHAERLSTVIRALERVLEAQDEYIIIPHAL
jgi:hypothetical protein